MKRRSFLKLLGSVPFSTLIPRDAETEVEDEWEVERDFLGKNIIYVYHRHG